MCVYSLNLDIFCQTSLLALTMRKKKKKIALVPSYYFSLVHASFSFTLSYRTHSFTLFLTCRIFVWSIFHRNRRQREKSLLSPRENQIYVCNMGQDYIYGCTECQTQYEVSFIILRVARSCSRFIRFNNFVRYLFS